MDTTTFVNFYEILEVSPTATPDQIKNAIKQQRRTWAKRQSHPDQQKRHEAEVRISQIADAERTLLDEGARAKYDQQLANYRPPTAPTANVSGDWLERAREFLLRGDANSASYAAREATQMQGDNADAWAVRARASLMLGRQNDAVFEFQEALRIQPDEPEYHFDLGTVYESNGQWASAMQCYEAASRIAPHVLMYRLAIASVYIQNDRASLALPILEQAHQEEPTSDIVQFYLALALHDFSVDQMTRVRDGSYHIISEESAHKVLELNRRADSLQFTDPELRSTIREKIEYAEGQLKMKFHVPWAGVAGLAADGCMAAIVLVLIGLFVLTFPFMFAGEPVIVVLLAPVWYWLMYKWHWRPAWKITEKQTRGMR